MNRRGFIKASLLVCAAPLIVRAGSLMSIAPRGILLPNGDYYTGGIINVKWFGANEKLLDNSIPFQNAIDFAAQYGHGYQGASIFIPCGRYNHPPNLPTKIHLLGEGKCQSIIKFN